MDTNKRAWASREMERIYVLMDYDSVYLSAFMYMRITCMPPGITFININGHRAPWNPRNLCRIRRSCNVQYHMSLPTSCF